MTGIHKYAGWNRWQLGKPHTVSELIVYQEFPIRLDMPNFTIYVNLHERMI